MHPTRPDELTLFKSAINLTEYAAGQGYMLDRQHSSRNSVAMRGPAGDKIIIARDAGSGHWMYFSVTDERDNGTIVDFVDHRYRLSLGAIRKELRPWVGLAAEDVAGAFKEMEAVASGTRCTNFFYHANINPRADEHLTAAQWDHAVATLEKHLGLEGQARFVVEHEKAGRTHRHVIWSRIDVEHMRTISDSNDREKCHASARQLEQEFHLARGTSRFDNDRVGPRQERGPTSWEMFRGQHSGIDPRDVKADVTALWRTTDSGHAFAAALEERGYILARGDRRDFCLIDPAGHDHSLARRIEGVKAAELRARMAEVDRLALPSVAEARAIQQARIAQRAAERTAEAFPSMDERDPLEKRRAARLGATLYDSADMASMHSDALRDVRERATLAQQKRDQQEQTQGRKPETATERVERLSREARGGAQELTERDKRRLAVEDVRQRAGITRTDGGRERERERERER